VLQGLKVRLALLVLRELKVFKVSKEKLVILVLLEQMGPLAQRVLKDLRDQQANKGLRDLRVPQVLKEQLDQQVLKVLRDLREQLDHKVRLDLLVLQVRLVRQAHKELRAFRVYKATQGLRDLQDLPVPQDPPEEMDQLAQPDHLRFWLLTLEVPQELTRFNLPTQTVW
jgi:hypothetical protein